MGIQSAATKAGTAAAMFIGIVFMSIGLLIPLFSPSKPSGWTETTGTVTNLTPVTGSKGGTTYQPTITYKVGGKEYTNQPNFSESGIRIGASWKIYYEPAHPENAKAPISATAIYIMLLFPLIGLILVVATLYGAARRRKRRQLITMGQPLQAITSNQAFTNTGANNGVRLVATAAMTDGTAREFTSEPLGISQTLAMQGHAGNVPITVYIDPNNPKLYYVDLSTLPKANAQTIQNIVDHIQN
jgi:hypothetical protein